MKRECPQCGSDKLESGKLRSAGAVHFRPDNAKFLTLKTADIELAGNLCVACGHVTLIADQKKAQALISGKESPV